MTNSDDTKNHATTGGIEPELESFLAMIILAIRSGEPLSEQIIPRELSKEELGQMIQHLDDVVQRSAHLSKEVAA